MTALGTDILLILIGVSLMFLFVSSKYGNNILKFFSGALFIIIGIGIVSQQIVGYENSWINWPISILIIGTGLFISINSGLEFLQDVSE